MTGLSEPEGHSFTNRTPEVDYLISIAPQARSACRHCLSPDTVFLNEDLGCGARGESDRAERHRRRHVPQHGPAVLANSILRAVYRASGCAVAFSLGRELLVNIGNGFHERPKFRIGLKLGLRSDPTRYRAKHFR